MSGTDLNDTNAQEEGSLLERIEKRRTQGAGRKRDDQTVREDTSQVPLPAKAPLGDPSVTRPLDLESDSPPESDPTPETSDTPKRQSGGLLDRLSRAPEEPVSGEAPAPEPPSTPDYPPAEELPEELSEEVEDISDFLRELDEAYAEPTPVESQSIFDETLPISPEAQQMMADVDTPSEPSQESTPQTTAPGPFTGGSEEITFMDATPSTSVPGDQVMGSRVDEALEHLREKMAKVAMEFAEGKINQAQFQAIYSRYQEQRIITEQLLARDPTTDAWQQVLTEGHTTFLRAQYEARVMGYTLHDNRSGEVIASHGDFGLSAEQLAHLLRSFYSTTVEVFGGGMRSTVIEDGRWVVFVSGQYTIGVMIYSRQPSDGQLLLVSDLHQDFERANEPALASGDLMPDALVYPQRFLLQDTEG